VIICSWEEFKLIKETKYELVCKHEPHACTSTCFLLFDKAISQLSGEAQWNTKGPNDEFFTNSTVEIILGFVIFSIKGYNLGFFNQGKKAKEKRERKVMVFERESTLVGSEEEGDLAPSFIINSQFFAVDIGWVWPNHINSHISSLLHCVFIVSFTFYIAIAQEGILSIGLCRIKKQILPSQ